MKLHLERTHIKTAKMYYLFCPLVNIIGNCALIYCKNRNLQTPKISAGKLSLNLDNAVLP